MNEVSQQDQPLAGSGGGKKVHVEYCGQLRDEAGTRGEVVLTDAAVASELWEELRRVKGFTMGTEVVRVAINDQIEPWTHPVCTADRIALFPPFSGG